MQIEIKLSDEEIERAVREYVNRMTKLDVTQYVAVVNLADKNAVLTYAPTMVERAKREIDQLKQAGSKAVAI